MSAGKNLCRERFWKTKLIFLAPKKDKLVKKILCIALRKSTEAKGEKTWKESSMEPSYGRIS
jgi:hypothetical protein